MTRYAENLIGNWEKEQFEPLREVALSQYQNNWDRLTNDFNNLKEDLQRNKELAQIQYGENIGNIQNNAYDKMSATYQDLATRGLSGSGLVDKAVQANTRATGQEVDKALTDLLTVSSEGVEGLSNANNKLSASQGRLNNDLAGRLAGITDAEGDNARQYANLVADITQSAAARAGSGRDKELEEQNDKIYQLIAINDIMSDDETDDNTKYFDLVRDAGVNPQQAEQILSSYNYNKINEKLNKKQNRLNEINYYVDKNYRNTNNPMAWWADQLSIKPKQNKINKLNDELSNYTYQDLKDIMGY